MIEIDKIYNEDCLEGIRGYKSDRKPSIDV